MISHLHHMTKSQSQGATVKKDMSKSPDSASLAQDQRTPNASTDSGHLHQAAEKMMTERRTGTSRGGVTKTEPENGTEIESDTGKGRTDMEEEMTGIDGKTKKGTESEAEKMTSTEGGGIQNGMTGMGRGKGAQKKESEIGTRKETEGRIQIKTEKTKRGEWTKRIQKRRRTLESRARKGKRRKKKRRWTSLLNAALMRL